MATLSFDGFSALKLSIEQLAAIPPDVKSEMLNDAIDIIVDAQKAKAEAYGVVDSHTMIDSIKKGKPKIGTDEISIACTPEGTRTRGGTKTRNAEIAYINEYGKEGVDARPFMRDANAEAEGPAVEAAENKYHNWLDKIGL